MKRRNGVEHSRPERSGEPRWVSITCLTAAAVALGLAINVRDGEYWPSALLLLSLALPLCVAGTVFWRAEDPGYGRTLGIVALFLLLCLQFNRFCLSPPSGWNEWSNDLISASARPADLYVWGAFAAFALALLLPVGWLRRVAVPLLLVIHLVMGLWLIRAAPSPRIDVFIFQQSAARTLLEGHNPYEMTFDDIYRSMEPGQRPVYGPDLVRDGKLAFGFPYPPLSLYLSTGGYAIAGDHRYAQLFAMTAAGALIAYARPGLLASLAAAMFLFTPRGFFVLGRGWTEPFVVLFLAATIFCACRARKLLPIALGLLLASKQYLALAALLVPLLMEGPLRWRAYLALLAKAGAIAFVVTAPFALWDWNAFWHSLVTVQKVAPFREDALSYLVWFYHKTGIKLGVLPAFIGALVAVGVALWRAERSPAGFAAAVAMVYLVFIALNKQAFANYYYFVIGALWCAVAVIPLKYAQAEPAKPLNPLEGNVR